MTYKININIRQKRNMVNVGGRLTGPEVPLRILGGNFL